MSHYADMYTRRSAFKSELKSYGMICLLAYGSLMLWAGFRIDTGRDLPLAAVLHMPVGWLISGLCLAAGVFCGGVAAKEFGEAEKGWWRKGSIAILFLMLGAFVLINVF